MGLVLTRYAGQLAAQLALGRRSSKIGGDGAGGETGLLRLGPVTSNAGTTYLLYYDPSANAIIYDEGYPVISQG